MEELFSPFGRIISSKVLPHNPQFEGDLGYTFISILVLV